MLAHLISLNPASPVTQVPYESHITKLEGLEISHALLGLFLFITVRQLESWTTQPPNLYTQGLVLKNISKAVTK